MVMSVLFFFVLVDVIVAVTEVKMFISWTNVHIHETVTQAMFTANIF